MKRILLSISTILVLTNATAQTAASLFSRQDSLQVKELTATELSFYNKVGHHGPAVENSMMALRIYFNEKGAIDVYSKSGKTMELLKYKWYPSSVQMEQEGAGCDEYYVGKTLGLGGINLWDGTRVVKLNAENGRKAKVGRTANGNYAELISYGVPYRGGKVDIAIRIDVIDKSREAIVSARSLGGVKVQFVTGVNYHKGSTLAHGKGFIATWGKHPADVSKSPVSIGGGMRYDASLFPTEIVENDMVKLISVETDEVRTAVVSASTKEKELSSSKTFVKYVKKMEAPELSARLGGEIDNIAYSSIDDGCPINTMEHFEAALKAGFTHLKTDMQLTKDGEIVLCHDIGFTLDENGRITRFDRKNSNGNNLIINEMTLAEVKALEHAKYFKELGHYAHVATLEEFFAFCKKNNVRMFTTIRNLKQAEILKRYKELVDKHKVEDLIIMNNYVANDKTLAEVRKVFPNLPFSYTMGPKTPLNKELIDKAAEDGNIVLSHSVLTLEKMPEAMWVYARERGVRIYGHFLRNELIQPSLEIGMCGFQVGKKEQRDIIISSSENR